MTFLVDTTFAGDEAPRRATPTGKIVRRADHEALLDAKGLIAQAREDADRIRRQAQDAYRAERQRGYAEGRRDAQAEQVATMADIARRTSAYLKEVEQDMAQLVVASIRRVVADFDPEDRVLAVVRGALGLLRRQKHVLLRVHTEDAAVVRARLQALLSEFPGVDYLDVVADDRYPRGVCRMESPIGTVEASLDQQLDALQHAIAGPARAACEVEAVTAQDTREVGGAHAEPDETNASAREARAAHAGPEKADAFARVDNDV